MNTSNKKINVVIIISNVDKAIGFEWLVENIDQSRFELSFILLNDKPSYLREYLEKKNIWVDELNFHGKSDIPKLLWHVARILRKRKADVIHTHLFAANLVGHIAGKLVRIKKRVYTRHSSNENRRYHGKQRYDHLVNRMATHIIAISENVKNILTYEENVDAGKIRLVHHGFDLDEFCDVSPDKVMALGAKYNPDTRSPVIGIIARYSHWKGIQFVIPAFQKLLEAYPNAFLILANARHGDFAAEITEQLKSLPDDSFVEIEFEKDIFTLYQLLDVYVHTPIDAELEAFGQTYVEALAAGVPSVFTLSGVAPEFIEHERNALVVNFADSDAVHDEVVRLLENEELRGRLAENGKQDVKEMFLVKTMVEKLEAIYAEPQN